MKPTAEYTLPASFTPQQQQELFEGILYMYDLADEIMATVAKDNVSNRAVQMDLARPFVTQLTNSANILAAFYTEIVRNGRPITPDLKDTIERAYQNIFAAFSDVLEGAEEKLLPKQH